MITIAITNYNRFEWVLNSFEKVLDDQRVSEIVISDDASNPDIFNQLSDALKDKKYSKVKLYRNENNLGGFLNKKKAISLASNEWVILLDSDNSIDISYLDIVYEKKDPTIIYCPSHAVCSSPILDYTEHIGLLNKNDFKHNLSQQIQIWDCIFNTGNCYFNKNLLLEALRKEGTLLNPYASDAYYFVYLWFKHIPNAKLEIVPNLKYSHRLHPDSYYISMSSQSQKFIKEIIDDVKGWVN